MEGRHPPNRDLLFVSFWGRMVSERKGKMSEKETKARELLTENPLTHDQELEDVYEFLDGVRESGVINMFGAGSFIQDEFLIHKRTAKACLMAWMETFADRQAQTEADQFEAADMTGFGYTPPTEEPDETCATCGGGIEIEGNSSCVTCDYEERQSDDAQRKES